MRPAVANLHQRRGRNSTQLNSCSDLFASPDSVGEALQLHCYTTEALLHKVTVRTTTTFNNSLAAYLSSKYALVYCVDYA